MTEGQPIARLLFTINPLHSAWMLGPYNKPGRHLPDHNRQQEWKDSATYPPHILQRARMGSNAISPSLHHVHDSVSQPSDHSHYGQPVTSAQNLPLLPGPPLKLNVDKNAKPVACHRLKPVLLHWQARMGSNAISPTPHHVHDSVSQPH